MTAVYPRPGLYPRPGWYPGGGDPDDTILSSALTPIGHTWSVFSRNTDYTLDVALPILSVKGVRRWLGVGTAIVTTPYTVARWQSLGPGHGIEVSRDGRRQFGGPVTARQFTWDESTNWVPTITVEAVSDEQQLADRVAMPDPQRRDDDQTVNDYWVRTTVPASTAMWQLISDQAGPSCYPTRRVPGLVMGDNPGVGAVHRYEGLFGDVLSTLRTFSIASGANLGVNMYPLAGQLRADILAPRDLRGTVKFSADLHNLVGVTYREAAPTVTDALAAGQGNLHSRLRVLATTTSGTALAWGRRIWSYIDRRDTADTTVLAQADSDALAAGAETVSLAVVLQDTGAAVYGTDYDLGDQVTVYVGLPGETKVATVADVIREISFEVDSANKELIRPAIGTYDATAQIPTPTQKQLYAVGQSLAGLIART